MTDSLDDKQNNPSNIESLSLQKIEQLSSHEKTYRCKMCGKPFKGLSSLKTHYRNHTGQKP